MFYISYITKHGPRDEDARCRQHPQWQALCNSGSLSCIAVSMSGSQLPSSPLVAITPHVLLRYHHARVRPAERASLFHSRQTGYPQQSSHQCVVLSLCVHLTRSLHPDSDSSDSVNIDDRHQCSSVFPPAFHLISVYYANSAITRTADYDSADVPSESGEIVWYTQSGPKRNEAVVEDVWWNGLRSR